MKLLKWIKFLIQIKAKEDNEGYENDDEDENESIITTINKMILINKSEEKSEKENEEYIKNLMLKKNKIFLFMKKIYPKI